MALAALIAAYQPTESRSDGLRATLPLVGRTLVEHQARQAVRAGARHVVLLVERVPPALTAAIDRLRRDGVPIDIARGPAHAADSFHPDERVLFFGDGCVIGQAAIDRLAAAGEPALLTLPDAPAHVTFERIDADARWAGLALLEGGLLRETAAMLGEWDLQSTLLRRAVQLGVDRIDLRESGGGLPLIADSLGALDGLERHLLAGSRGRARSWPGRWLFAPIEAPLLRLLVPRVGEAMWIAAAAAWLAVAAVPMALGGWFWPALIALMLSGPAVAVAERLASMRLASVRYGRTLEAIRLAGAAATMLALAWHLATSGGWGWWLVAAGVGFGMAALSIERRTAAALGAPVASLWLATMDSLIWALPPFALLGRWDAGLAFLACYALASFAWVQRRAGAAADQT